MTFARYIVPAVLAAVLTAPAHAATIAKIDKTRTKIMLNLTKDELSKLKVGDRITVKDEAGGVKVSGSILKIKKSQAMVQLDRSDIETGTKVTVGPEDEGGGGGSGSTAATKTGDFNAEIEVASLPYASLFTDDGAPGADDTTLDTNSILPLPLANLGLRLYTRFGDFALGPELAFVKHDLKVASKTTTNTDPPADPPADPVSESDKLTVTLLQAGVCAKHSIGVSTGSRFGFVPRLCVGYVGKSGKSVNLNYKDSGIYAQVGPGFYYKFGASIGLGLSFDYHLSQITAKTISVPSSDSGSTTGVTDVTIDSKETRTHLGIGYSLFFLF